MDQHKNTFPDENPSLLSIHPLYRPNGEVFKFGAAMDIPEGTKNIRQLFSDGRLDRDILQKHPVLVLRNAGRLEFILDPADHQEVFADESHVPVQGLHLEEEYVRTLVPLNRIKGRNMVMNIFRTEGVARGGYTVAGKAGKVFASINEKLKRYPVLSKSVSGYQSYPELFDFHSGMRRLLRIPEGLYLELIADGSLYAFPQEPNSLLVITEDGSDQSGVHSYFRPSSRAPVPKAHVRQTFGLLTPAGMLQTIVKDKDGKKIRNLGLI